VYAFPLSTHASVRGRYVGWTWAQDRRPEDTRMVQSNAPVRKTGQFLAPEALFYSICRILITTTYQVIRLELRRRSCCMMLYPYVKQ
jgi:hypothetical protein